MSLSSHQEQYQPIFACLVAETGGPKSNQNKKNSSNAAAQQRRAKVSIDATNCRKVKDGSPLFILKVEYHSSNQSSSSPSSSERRYAFQIGTSKLTWISDSQNQNERSGTSNQNYQNSNSHSNECSAIFSKMISLNNDYDEKSGANDGDGTSSYSSSSTTTCNCIVTFEKIPEARIFARQMHWLFEVKLPSLAQSFSPPSANSLSPTTVSCALVALPIQWWFEGWGTTTSGSGSATTTKSESLDLTTLSSESLRISTDRRNDNKPTSSFSAASTTTDDHPLLSSNLALILTSSGISNATWDVESGEEENQDPDQNNSTSVPSSVSLLYSSSLSSVLPLLQSPRPTKSSESGTSSLDWSPCFSSSMLASSIEGSTVFYKNSSSSSSSTSKKLGFQSHQKSSLSGHSLFDDGDRNDAESSLTNPFDFDYCFSTQPVPLQASPQDMKNEQTLKNRAASVFGMVNNNNNNHNSNSNKNNLSMSATTSFSVADVVAAQQRQQENDLIDFLMKKTPHVSPKNVGSMNLVSTVTLDTVSKRIILNERSGGVNITHLTVSSPNKSNNQTTAPKTRRCEFKPATSTSSSVVVNFIAVPLQEAIAEAASAADDFVDLHNPNNKKSKKTNNSTLAHADADENDSEKNNTKHHDLFHRVKSLFRNFYLGPNSTAISSSARVLCAAPDSFSGEPTPVVYNATKKCLALLPRSEETRSTHWATILVQACFPFAFGDTKSEVYQEIFDHDDSTKTSEQQVLYPILLFPTRHSPSFPATSLLSNQEDHNSSSSSAASSLLYHQRLLLSSSNNNSPDQLLMLSSSSSASKDSTLHEILLVSALRSNILSYGLGLQSNSSNALFLSTNVINTGASHQQDGGNINNNNQPINMMNILLNKPRALNQLNICVVGSVGCGKSTLISALAKGQQQQQHSSSNQNENNIHPLFASDLSSTLTMSEDLIFACSFDLFNGYSSSTNCVYSCCSASTRAVDEKYQKVQPVVVEAPAQSLPALSGTIAAADIILCVVNCLLPHSLTWIEEKIKPILDQQRCPILSVDAQGLNHSKPNVILVTVNSTSYKRTVTPEEVSELAAKLTKNCQVADLEFGEASSASSAEYPSSSSGPRFSADDAKIIVSTIGRTVQCCASYSRLLNAGWLPLHADWLVMSFCYHWESIFIKRSQQKLLLLDSNSTPQDNQRNSSFEATATPRANEEDYNSDNKRKYRRKQNHQTGNGKSLLLTVLEDPVCVGLHESISRWLENDLLFSGGCPFTIYDCVHMIALATSARDLRGQLVKLLSLKNCVQRNAVSKVIASAVSRQQKHQKVGDYDQNNSTSFRSSPSSYTTGRSDFTAVGGTPSSGGRTPGNNNDGNNHDDDFEEEDDEQNANEEQNPIVIASLTKAKKIAKKVFSLFSKKPSKNELDQKNGQQQQDQHQQTALSSSSLSSLTSKKDKDHPGLPPSAILFLLSTFGVVVSTSWIYTLWGEVVSASSEIATSAHSLPPISQHLWLKFLNISSVSKQQQLHHGSSSRLSTPSAAIASGSPTQKTATTANSPTSYSGRSKLQKDDAFPIMKHQQSLQIDFSLVVFHWALELAKSSNSEFFSAVRSGWLSRPVDEFDEVETNNTNSVKSPTSSPSGIISTRPAASSPTNSAAAASATYTTIAGNQKCRSCGLSRTNDQLIRCVVCDKKSCVIGNDSNINKSKKCTVFVGGREAEQRREALLSVARTTGGATDDKTISMLLKQLPHVCNVCLMAHPARHWQPDQEATSCYCCGAKFTLTRRRHHCRRDGNIVCGSCSKFEGPAFGYPSSQRICIQCYDSPSPFVPLAVGDDYYSNHQNHEDEENHNDIKQNRVAGTTRNNDEFDNENNFDRNNNNLQQQKQQQLYNESSSSDSEATSSSDDDDDDDDPNNSSSRHRGSDDLDSTTTLSRNLSRGISGGDEDPRTVFAPWAHLVLNSEPDTVYHQPWYETLNGELVENVLHRIKMMIREENENKKRAKNESSASSSLHHHNLYYSHYGRSHHHVPRAEYVVRQPGYLEEADKKLEDAAVGDEYPSEFDPDE